jgi:ribosomal protein S18 acetylase RimI-like enzyme
MTGRSLRNCTWYTRNAARQTIGRHADRPGGIVRSATPDGGRSVRGRGEDTHPDRAHAAFNNPRFPIDSHVAFDHVTGSRHMEDLRLASDPRRATREDLQAVEEIVRAAYSHYVPRIGRQPGPMLDDYGALIEQGRVHVVERDGVVQGILVLIPQEDAMLLDNIAVAPAAQGLGQGRIMLDFAERAAIAAGYRTIKLYTNEAMTENIGIYARRGYSETHRVEENGLRRVYMVKRLG